MAGRKPKVSPSVVLDAVLLYKDRVVFTNDAGEKSMFRIINIV